MPEEVLQRVPISVEYRAELNDEIQRAAWKSSFALTQTKLVNSRRFPIRPEIIRGQF